MLASEILRASAYELNDLEPGAEYTRWPEAELLDYLNEALAQLGLLRPLLFSSTIKLPLAPGGQQRLPDGVEALQDIPFNLNPDGSLGAPILPGSFGLERAYGKGVCSNGDAYAVRSYAMASDAIFYVDPPVPPIGTHEVQALVQLAPQVITTADTPIVFWGGSPNTYRNQLKDWVLYRAFAKDSESQASGGHAQEHFKAFYQALGSPPRNKQAVPLANAGVQDAKNAG